MREFGDQARDEKPTGGQKERACEKVGRQGGGYRVQQVDNKPGPDWILQRVVKVGTQMLGEAISIVEEAYVRVGETVEGLAHEDPLVRRSVVSVDRSGAPPYACKEHRACHCEREPCGSSPKELKTSFSGLCFSLHPP